VTPVLTAYAFLALLFIVGAGAAGLATRYLSPRLASRHPPAIVPQARVPVEGGEPPVTLGREPLDQAIAPALLLCLALTSAVVLLVPWVLVVGSILVPRQQEQGLSGAAPLGPGFLVIAMLAAGVVHAWGRRAEPRSAEDEDARPR
jgi:NADH:ubiquinone oxidoreductase subunit 3 (subunit A)